MNDKNRWEVGLVFLGRLTFGLRALLTLAGTGGSGSRFEYLTQAFTWAVVPGKRDTNVAWRNEVQVRFLEAVIVELPQP
jgi:hypothetical protein